VIGKHSGSHAVKAKFKEYDIELTEPEANEILARVRNHSINLKRSLFDKELIYIYEEYLRERNSNG